MSFDIHWAVDKYREEHECDEHWELRKAFMERWKTSYPEERLVCLARVFANVEFMGCRYPTEIMQEVAHLSHEVAQNYRNSRRNKLKRTFVSASLAAADRAKGVKREGGVITEAPTSKSSKICFVPQGHVNEETEVTNTNSDEDTKDPDTHTNSPSAEPNTSYANNEYMKELLAMKCVDVRKFSEKMFFTEFGRLVLLVRPWASKFSNIQSSCTVCGIQLTNTFEDGCFSLLANGKLIAQATGVSKAKAKSAIEEMAWKRLEEAAVNVLFKEQWIAHGDARVSVSDVSGRKQPEFGTPIESSVATKMMQMMGWKGGGLGAEAQGIAEPIKPNLQMVNREGLGSTTTDCRQLRRAGADLMRRYIASSTFDVDLVFSADFSKEERAALHQCAQRAGLASKSYGDKERFLVVKKKLDPFSLVRAVIENGGNTPKYQVFIPAALDWNAR